MNKIDEMIKKNCPNGVPKYSIGDLIYRGRERGKDDPTIKTVYAVSNKFGIVRSDEMHDRNISSDDTSNYSIIRKGMFAYNPSRLNIGSIGYLQEDVDGLLSPMYVVFSIKENLALSQYLMLNLKSSFVKHKIDSLKEEGARFRFEFDRWKKIFISVPPIEVQQEIVNILDNFTELTAELTAELEARKKQYEYYRDKLLSFDKPENPNGGGYDLGVVTKKLGEIAKIHNGADYKSFGEGEIPVYGTSGIMTYIDRCAYDKPTVLIPRKGSIEKLYYVDTPFWNVDTIFYTEIDTSVVVPKYLYYLLKKEHLEQYNTAGGVPSLTQSVLKEIALQIPSIDVQQRIVNILDKFEMLSNSLVDGLPAEIEARRKQYEYYRDLLLDFRPESSIGGGHA